MFNEQLKIIRKSKNIKQLELAGMLGCTPTHMSLLESGVNTPSMKFLKRWVNILDCEIRILLK